MGGAGPDLISMQNCVKDSIDLSCISSLQVSNAPKYIDKVKHSFIVLKIPATALLFSCADRCLVFGPLQVILGVGGLYFLTMSFHHSVPTWA